MIFARTAEGLANLHLFYGVDLVLFCEGGKNSYSVSEAQRGAGAGDCPDVKFWALLSQIYLPGKSVVVRGMGSKTAVLALHERIVELDRTTVAVAVDADFSVLFGELACSSTLLHTRGYSWESDVWSEEVLGELLSSLCTLEPSDSRPAIAAREVFRALRGGCRWGVRAEVLLWRKGRTLWERDGWMRHIQVSGGIPQVDRAYLVEKLKRLRLESVATLATRELPSDAEVSVERHLFGHLLADFCYEGLRGCLKGLTAVWRLPKATVAALAISVFCAQLRAAPLSEMALHYSDAFGGLGVTAE